MGKKNYIFLFIAGTFFWVSLGGGKEGK